MDISEKDRRTRLKIGSVLGLLFTVASLFTLVFWYAQIADSVRSNSWPAVRGVVLSSELHVDTDSDSGKTYYPNIIYSYHVAGQEYTAEKLQFVQDGFGKNWALRKLDAYPVDAVVEVSYDPDLPQTAVLEPGGKLIWYFFVAGVALAFWSVFTVLALLLFKDVRKMVLLGKSLRGQLSDS